MTEREPHDPARPAPSPLEPLWRHILGHKLRMLRLANGEKLTETAARAGISPQYLSEIERGLKEPSSEMIAAIVGALGLTLLDLTEQLADDLRSTRGVTDGRVLAERRSGEVFAFAA